MEIQIKATLALLAARALSGKIFQCIPLIATCAFLTAQGYATPKFSWVLQANGGLLIVASNPGPNSANCAASWDVSGEEFGETKSKHFYLQFFVPAERENVKVVVGGGVDLVNTRLVGDPSIACFGGAAIGSENTPRRIPKPVSAPPVSKPVVNSSPSTTNPLPDTSSPANRPRGVFVAGLPEVPNADGKIPVQTWIFSCSSSWDGSCSSNPNETIAVAPRGWQFCTADVSVSNNKNGRIIEHWFGPTPLVCGSTRPEVITFLTDGVAASRFS